MKSLQIRWLIRRDMPDVLRIERQHFDQPWTDEDFLKCLRQRNCIGMVAEQNHEILGFMIYKLHKSRLVILNFAVDKLVHKKGVGTAMIDRLKDKLSQERRKEINLRISEKNTGGQLFFQRQGFKAVSVVRSYYENGDDAYVMQFRTAYEPETLYAPKNRISEYF